MRAHLLGRPIAALAQQANLGDPHPLIGRLAHIIDGQRLHLGAGLAGGVDLGADIDDGRQVRTCLAQLEIDLDVGEKEGVAERDEGGGTLSCHYP